MGTPSAATRVTHAASAATAPAPEPATIAVWPKSCRMPPKSSARKGTKGLRCATSRARAACRWPGFITTSSPKSACFTSFRSIRSATIVQRLKSRLERVDDPEERVRIFILNHLEYFLANQAAMKVLSHEAEALKNGFGSEVAAIKREYYRICVGLLDELKRDRGLAILHADRRVELVWHDELDLHLAQSARGCRCGVHRARDGRYLSARSAERRQGAARSDEGTDLKS